MHTSVRSFVKLNRGKVIKESEIYRAEFCKGGEVNSSGQTTQSGIQQQLDTDVHRAVTAE